MARIEVQPIPRKKVSTRELLAELCYHYPQYSLAEARNLPARDVVLLLKTVNRIKAREYHNLTQIAAAPHTKKGAGVRTLSTRYQKEATNG